MLRARWTQYLVSIALIASGCQEVAAPPRQQEAELAFNFGNAPPTSGIVVRFNDQIGLVWSASDPVSGLTALVGVSDLPKLCNGDFGGIQKHPVQYLFTGGGAIPAKGHSKDDIVTVYQADIAPYDDICALIPLTPVAKGFIRIAWLDNDVTAVGPGGNTYQMNGGGTIDDLVNGGKVRLLVHNVLQLAPGADYDIALVKQVLVRVRLGNAPN
jgi:hypothetical protein